MARRPVEPDDDDTDDSNNAPAPTPEPRALLSHLRKLQRQAAAARDRGRAGADELATLTGEIDHMQRTYVRELQAAAIAERAEQDARAKAEKRAHEQREREAQVATLAPVVDAMRAAAPDGIALARALEQARADADAANELRERMADQDARATLALDAARAEVRDAEQAFERGERGGWERVSKARNERDRAELTHEQAGKRADAARVTAARCAAEVAAAAARLAVAQGSRATHDAATRADRERLAALDAERAAIVARLRTARAAWGVLSGEARRALSGASAAARELDIAEGSVALGEAARQAEREWRRDAEALAAMPLPTFEGVELPTFEGIDLGALALVHDEDDE